MAAGTADPNTRGVNFDHVGLRYRVVHGYRRAYRMAGTGPALLLVHGISDNSMTWLRVLPKLAQHYTVIAPDLLGHGSSAKPRADYSATAYACGLRDLLTVLDVDRVTVVGHSLGGGVAMQFAYQFPQQCERIALLGAGGVGREVSLLLRLAAAPGAELAIPFVTAEPVRAVLSRLLPLIPRLTGLDTGPDLAHVLHRYVALHDPAARAAFLRTLRSVVDVRGQVVTMLDRCYLNKAIPTLLLWGGRDRIVPVAHAELAHAAMPGSRLEIFPKAGHFPHHSEPDRFVALLDEFIATTEPARYDRVGWRELLLAGRVPPEPADPGAPAALDRATVSSGS